MVGVKEIAKRAQVSPITVSRALRGSELGKRNDARVRAERIRRIAHEMGYRANAAARSMSVGRFDAVALTFRQSRASFLPTGFGVHLATAASRHQLSLHLSAVPDVSPGDDLPAIVRNLVVDGLIIDELNPPDWLVEALARYRIPAIWMNQKLDSDCVYPDDRGLMRRQVDRLIGMGHRRIVFTGTSTPHFSETERRAGYREQMEHHGLRPNIFETRYAPGDAKGLSSGIDEKSMAATLSVPDRPTALITTSSAVTFHWLSVIRQLGLSVPQDLSIVMIGVHNQVALFGMKVDLIWFPGKPMADALIQEFLAKRDAPDIPRDPVVTGFEPYVDNGSVAPPPADPPGVQTQDLRSGERRP
jgi:DNA-binding LacI/PurR family transcriptional regulator